MKDDQLTEKHENKLEKFLCLKSLGRLAIGHQDGNRRIWFGNLTQEYYQAIGKKFRLSTGKQAIIHIDSIKGVRFEDVSYEEIEKYGCANLKRMIREMTKEKLSAMFTGWRTRTGKESDLNVIDFSIVGEGVYKESEGK